MSAQFQIVRIGSRFGILKETFDRTGHREAEIIESGLETRGEAEQKLAAMRAVENGREG